MSFAQKQQTRSSPAMGWQQHISRHQQNANGAQMPYSDGFYDENREVLPVPGIQAQATCDVRFVFVTHIASFTAELRGLNRMRIGRV